MPDSSTSQRSRISVHAEWKQALREELDPDRGIPAVLRRRPALSNWDHLRSAPSSRLETELLYALQIGVADYEHPYTRQCLKRAAEVYAAGADDPRWTTWWRHSRSVEHGRFRSLGEVVDAWLQERNLDRAALHSAADELLTGALSDRPVWSEIAQSEYLHGIELLILVDDRLEARERLSLPKPFDAVSRHHAWLVRLIDVLASEDAEVVREFFDSYFDRLRSPFFQQTASAEDNVVGIAHLRLRLALIRWIYIERKPIAGNWRHIIGQIGY